MKLSTFTKVNISNNTKYAVFNGEQYIEDFTVNYLDEQDKLNAAIIKRMSYEDAGAIVQHVDVYKGQLEVTLNIKGVRK